MSEPDTVKVDDGKMTVPEKDGLYELPVSKGVEGKVTVPFPALKDYFNIGDDVTDGQKAKFEVIYGYFEDEADSVGDLMYKLRQLENRLGSPAIGETRLTKLYNYVKISAQIKDKEKERDSLLRK